MQITKQAWFLLSHLYLVPRSEETRSVGISWHILQPTKDHALSVFNMLGFAEIKNKYFSGLMATYRGYKIKFWRHLITVALSLSRISPCRSVIQGFGWSSSSNIWCKCVSLHKFCIITWVCSAYYKSTICVLYYVLYECDLRIILRIIWVRSAWRRKARVLTILA